jgi:hypothetical protein
MMVPKPQCGTHSDCIRGPSRRTRRRGGTASHPRRLAGEVYSLQFVDDPRWSHIENHMLLIVGAVIVLIAVVIISRMRGSGRMGARNHGRMSERWLAEQRASDSH